MTTDADAEDTFTYSLAAGISDNDNFQINTGSDELRAEIVFDFETKSSYSILKLMNKPPARLGITA